VRVAAAGCLVRETDGSVQASARRFPTSRQGLPAERLDERVAHEPLDAAHLVAREDLRTRSRSTGFRRCMMVRRAAFEPWVGWTTVLLYWEEGLCSGCGVRGWLTVYNPVVGIYTSQGRSSAWLAKNH